MAKLGSGIKPGTRAIGFLILQWLKRGERHTGRIAAIAALRESFPPIWLDSPALRPRLRSSGAASSKQIDYVESRARPGNPPGGHRQRSV